MSCLLDFLKSNKIIIEYLKDIATIIAIIAGGIWTYLLFIKKRQKYPRAQISHQITHWLLEDNKSLLHLVLRISNQSDVLLPLISGKVMIQQVLPLKNEILTDIDKGEDPVKKGQTEILWPLLCERKWTPEVKSSLELEPNESDELHFDFILPSNVQTIEIYSYFKNITKPEREIGWSLTTIHDFNQPQEKDKSSNK